MKQSPNNDTDYINACYIDVSILKIVILVQSPFGEDQKIIAAQGPLDNTIRHFWRMVVQENVTMIVSTCNLVEGKIQKCEMFWPDKQFP